MQIQKRLGANIRQLRDQKNWSQEELAVRTGLHRTYISSLERGLRNPTIIVLEKIARAYNVPLTKLVEGM